MDTMSTRRVGGLLVALVAVVAATGGLFAAEGEYEWVGGQWIEAAAPAEGSPAGELALIRRHQADGRRRETVRAGKKFLDKYPDDARGEEAMLLAGEAELDAHRYWQAYEWYKRLADEHPNGKFYERALDRQFKVAEAFLAGKKRIVLGFLRISAYGDGQEILFSIAAHSPGSALAERALMRVAEFYFNRRDYVEAIETYDEYLEMFPKSHRSSLAMLRGAQASLADYRGPAHEDTPLIEARQRFLMFAEQFPDDAAKIGVDRILDQITSERARKAFEGAAFYERIDRPAPAKICYQYVVADYGDTEWAAQARERISRLDSAATKGGHQK